jgi:RNA polymerase sigma-70 factor (ECF subfamily)
MEEARTLEFDSLEIDVVSCIPMLRRYALKLARNGPDADDLVQDCLLRALSRQHQFEPGTNLLAWLTTILRNLFFTACQRRKRMVEVPLEPDAAQASHDAPQIHRIALSDTGRAIQGLSADQKRVVQRCGVEGTSYEDAAEEMGVSVGTIRSRLSRARSYLREQVAGRIRPAYLSSRGADVRVENTRHYHIRRIERHAACPEDVPAKQPERNEHPRTPAETTLAYPLAGISNAATCKIPKPLRVAEVTVDKSGRILLTGAGFPRALPGGAANDFGNFRISGLAAEQVGSRGGAPPRLFRSPAKAERIAAR